MEKWWAWLERQKFFDLVRKMARLALPIEHCASILGLSIVAAETVREPSGAQTRPVRMFRIPGLAIRRDMAARNHDRIAFNRRLMHHARVAGGTTLSLASHRECRHMFAVAHDQTHVFDGGWQIARRHF